MHGFKNQPFRKILSEIPSECQTVCLLQTTLEGKELMMFANVNDDEKLYLTKLERLSSLIIRESVKPQHEKLPLEVGDEVRL